MFFTDCFNITANSVDLQKYLSDIPEKDVTPTNIDILLIYNEFNSPDETYIIN